MLCPLRFSSTSSCICWLRAVAATPGRQRGRGKTEHRERREEPAQMPATGTVLGALLGLGTQIYSNALRKLPLMRHPWEHVLGMGLGAVFVNQLVKWNEKLHDDLEKMIEKSKAANERRYFDDDED